MDSSAGGMMVNDKVWGLRCHTGKGKQVKMRIDSKSGNWGCMIHKTVYFLFHHNEVWIARKETQNKLNPGNQSWSRSVTKLHHGCWREVFSPVAFVLTSIERNSSTFWENTLIADVLKNQMKRLVTFIFVRCWAGVMRQLAIINGWQKCA